MADDNGVDTGADDTKLDDKGAVDTSAKDSGTILDAGDKGASDDKGSADQGDKGKGTDAPDWRVQMAGDDKEAIKRLSRFAAPADVFKSFRSLEQKISSGEFKKPLGENATPEEKATWRKENGLPEKADDYVAGLALPSGLVIGEAEKPVVSALASVAHEGNIDPKAFNGLVSKYYELQDQQRQAREDADARFKGIRRRAPQGLAGPGLPAQPDRGQQHDGFLAGGRVASRSRRTRSEWSASSAITRRSSARWQRLRSSSTRQLRWYRPARPMRVRVSTRDWRKSGRCGALTRTSTIRMTRSSS
jgi:hypothetical protein